MYSESRNSVLRGLRCRGGKAGKFRSVLGFHTSSDIGWDLAREATSNGAHTKRESSAQGVFLQIGVAPSTKHQAPSNEQRATRPGGINLQKEGKIFLFTSLHPAAAGSDQPDVAGHHVPQTQ